MSANKVKKPILLIHGEEDNNSGTLTMQVRKLLMFSKICHAFRNVKELMSGCALMELQMTSVFNIWLNSSLIHWASWVAQELGCIWAGLGWT